MLALTKPDPKRSHCVGRAEEPAQSTEYSLPMTGDVTSALQTCPREFQVSQLGRSSRFLT